MIKTTANIQRYTAQHHMRTKAVDWRPETEQEITFCSNQCCTWYRDITSRSVATSRNVRASGLRKYRFAVLVRKMFLTGPKVCVPHRLLRTDHETGRSRRKRTDFIILTSSVCSAYTAIASNSRSRCALPGAQTSYFVRQKW